MTTTYDLKQGDVLERLRELPDESAHCVVTSPPYWGLRDYGTAKWEGGDPECYHKGKYEHTVGYGSPKQATSQGASFVASGDCLCGAIRIDNQLGLEPTPEQYVAKIVEVFREVRRVLHSSGTVWLNLGDSYSGSGKGRNPDGFAHHAGFETHRKQSTHKGTLIGNVESGIVPNSCKPKDLVGVPWMVAFALRADGWYLRSDIIWAKSNPMPESVTDRPTKSHEYIFLFSKSERYFFDQEAVREQATSTDNSLRDRDSTKLNNTSGRTPMGGLTTNGYHYRNVRSVWHIATQPFSDAHFATFPEELVRRCVLAGTSEKGVCGECGAPWKRLLEVKPMAIDRSERTHELGRTRSSGTMVEPRESVTTGWQSSCKCAAPIIPATVLDPFSGSGTTGVMASKLGRNFIGIELNPQYVEMAERRLWKVNQQEALFQ